MITKRIVQKQQVATAPLVMGAFGILGFIPGLCVVTFIMCWVGLIWATHSERKQFWQLAACLNAGGILMSTAGLLFTYDLITKGLQ